MIRTVALMAVLLPVVFVCKALFVVFGAFFLLAKFVGRSRSTSAFRMAESETRVGQIAYRRPWRPFGNASDSRASRA